MKRILAFVFAVVLGFAASAEAAQPYDERAFMAAQAEGKPILVHVTAPWCPTCRAQKPVVSALEKENMALMVFEVDFDSQKEALKQFGVSQQSTLIAFSGATETGRATGITDPMKIRDLTAKATMMEKPMMDMPAGKPM